MFQYSTSQGRVIVGSLESYSNGAIVRAIELFSRGTSRRDSDWTRLLEIIVLLLFDNGAVTQDTVQFALDTQSRFVDKRNPYLKGSTRGGKTNRFERNCITSGLETQRIYVTQNRHLSRCYTTVINAVIISTL